MSMIISGDSGITFPNSTVQASAGQVLQVVQANLTSVISTNSASYVTTGLTASITPKFSTSKILVLVSGNLYVSSSTTSSYATIYRNGANILGTNGFMGINSNGIIYSGSGNYLDSPATTSSTAYAIYFNYVGSGALAYFNISPSTVSITLMEIAG
jgi:hypothetical protein